MDTTAWIAHLLNFVAPAGLLGLLLPLAGRFVVRNRVPGLVWWAQAAIVFVVSCLVLLAGLAGFGNDGKMATYGAMVGMAASTQWLLLRAWR